MDIAFLLTPAIVSGIYTNLKAELNIKLAKDDIDIAKISPDKAKRNTVHIAIYVNVPQVLFNRAVNELNSEQFRKQLLQGTDASYQKYIGKRIDKSQAKQRQRNKTILMSADPANVMKSNKFWRSKTNLEIDKAKKDKCSTCNHTQTQNYFQSDLMNGINISTVLKSATFVAIFHCPGVSERGFTSYSSSPRISCRK